MVQCADCGMDFDSHPQLVNHKLKFCVHTKNFDRLDQKLNELSAIERDVDSRISHRSNPKPKSTIHSAGREIVGFKKPPSPLSDHNRQQPDRDYVAGNIKKLQQEIQNQNDRFQREKEHAEV
jgi:hypothetical protein